MEYKLIVFDIWMGHYQILINKYQRKHKKQL